MPEIMENAEQWSKNFTAGWLEHLTRTGKIDWDQYRYLRNRTPIVSSGLNLSRARLLLVSTAGAYDPSCQDPFDAASPLGDYSLRTFSTSLPLSELSYAHEHYDHTARQQDPRVNLPQGYLAEMVNEEELGELAPTMVSLSGYHPDAKAVVDQVIPQIQEVARQVAAEAVLLVPV